MYKMTVYSQWQHELKLERIIRFETFEEAFVMAQEKLKYCLGFEKLSLTRVRKGKYLVFNNRRFVGELKLLKL